MELKCNSACAPQYETYRQYSTQPNGFFVFFLFFRGQECEIRPMFFGGPVPSREEVSRFGLLRPGIGQPVYRSPIYLRAEEEPRLQSLTLLKSLDDCCRGASSIRHAFYLLQRSSIHFSAVRSSLKLKMSSATHRLTWSMLRLSSAYSKSAKSNANVTSRFYLNQFKCLHLECNESG